MKAAVYKGPYQIEIDELDYPRLKDNEVLIKVAYAGICGTDIHIYKGNYRTRPPMIIGHELSGEIIEIRTKDNTTLKAGDRVVVRPTLYCGNCYACKAGKSHVCKKLEMLGIDYNGAFAEFIKAPLGTVYRISGDITLKNAALIEPLAVAIHSVRNSGLMVGDKVGILGAGPIGILVGMVAKIAGAGAVYIADLNDYRVTKAREAGLNAINSSKTNFVEYISKATIGIMTDISFEAAGAEETARMLTDITRINGQMVIISAFRDAPKLDLLSVTFKEQKVSGSRVYGDEDYNRALFLLNEHPEIGNIVTDIIPLAEVQSGLEAIINGENIIKILVKI